MKPRRLILRRTDTPIGDMLHDVTNGEPLPTWNRDRGRLAWGQTREPGGEWDYIRALPIKTRRRLAGAGFMARSAMEPDVFADMIRSHAPGMSGASDAECHAWFVRHALLAIAERRRVHHRDRHHAFAQDEGHPSYYALRDARARSAGHRSLWHLRKARGWV